MLQTRTIKHRLRDKHAAELTRQASAVNFVWNYCNGAQKHVRRWDRWLSSVDLQRMTAGVSKELNIHSQTVQNVCKQYVKSRVQHKKPWLRWRGRTSLGWIPFNTGVTFDGEAFTFRGVRYEPMHLRKGIEYPTSCTGGCFSQDAHGRWYINIVVEVPIADQAPVSRVGIDLGLKALATLSDGGEIAIPQFYRNSEVTLATTQRARKTRRIRNIHARIANRRKDFLHKKSA